MSTFENGTNIFPRREKEKPIATVLLLASLCEPAHYSVQ